MTTNRHTPGPWFVGEEPYTIKYTSRNGTNYELASVFCSETLAHLEADVNLIAAAPDMLEALNSIELGRLTPKEANKVIAALNKAGGTNLKRIMYEER